MKWTASDIIAPCHFYITKKSCVTNKEGTSMACLEEKSFSCLKDMAAHLQSLHSCIWTNHKTKSRPHHKNHRIQKGVQTFSHEYIYKLICHEMNNEPGRTNVEHVSSLAVKSADQSACCFVAMWFPANNK